MEEFASAVVRQSERDLRRPSARSLRGEQPAGALFVEIVVYPAKSGRGAAGQPPRLWTAEHTGSGPPNLDRPQTHRQQRPDHRSSKGVALTVGIPERAEASARDDDAPTAGGVRRWFADAEVSRQIGKRRATYDQTQAP